MAAKFITKADLKGYDFNEADHRYLFNIVNAKTPDGYNGRYFSTWYFDFAYDGMREAIRDMIWALTLTYFRGHAYDYKHGHMSQLRLSDVTEFVADKMNTSSWEIVRWMKGMEFGGAFDLDVCDRWGLDTITIFINK